MTSRPKSLCSSVALRYLPSITLALALMGCNQPPGEATVALGPIDARTTDDIVVQITADALDPNRRDSVRYAFRWTQDGLLRADLTGDTVRAAETAKGQVWRVEVVASDGRHDGAAASAEVTIANTPPVVEVGLSATDPVASDDVEVLATAFDADGDEVSLSYAWTLNGEPTDLTDAVLPAARTERGQIWEVTVTPDDGEAQGAPISASVSIENLVPTITIVELLPADPNETTVLEARVEASDIDGDPLTVNYQWKVNGAVVQEGSDATLSGAFFDKHDEVQVVVTAHDGFVHSPAQSSEVVTVRNSAPEATSAAVQPARALEDTLLSCDAGGFTDVDGDAVTHQSAWFVNSVLVSHAPQLDGASFNKHDAIVCVATPDDGEVLGAPVTSEAIEVINSLPSIDVVRLMNPTPHEGDVLIAEVGGQRDIDGDSVQLIWEWFVNGQVVSTETSLSSDQFSAGDDVWVRVTPGDGEAFGSSMQSAHVTIADTAPVIRGIALQPSELRTGDDLIATVDTFDVDADTVALTYLWYVEQVLAHTSTEPVLPSSFFQKGQLVYVEVVADDGTMQTLPTRSEVKMVLNTAPSLAEARMDATELRKDSVVSCEALGAEDADGDAVDFSYRWVVDGVEVGQQQHLDGALFAKGSEVFCSVTPSDGEDSGVSRSSEPLIILNSAPSLGGVGFSNSAPREGDQVVASTSDVVDIDGDAVSMTYSWFVNGDPVSTDSFLDSSLFDKGDEIWVVITPNDGESAGMPTPSAHIFAVNSVPLLAAVSLAPAAANTDSTLVASMDASDADGDAISYNLAWYVDAVLVANGDVSELDGTFFSKGQTISVVATPTDGEGAGVAMRSMGVLIGNTAPSISGVSIAPSAAFEATVLTCAPDGWADADQDPEGYRYAWTRDGVQIADTQTLSGDAFDKGDALACTVTPYDDEDAGEPLTSAPIAIQNTLPVLASALLSSNGPAAGETVTAIAGAAADADGDVVTLDYVWFVNGAQVATGSSLASDLFHKGDEIWVVITPSDDVGAGAPIESAHATAINTVPVIDLLSLTPTTPRTDDTLVASADVSDADGDDLTYTYDLLVNGAPVDSNSSGSFAPSWFHKGDTVQVRLTVNDGESDSLSALSSSPIIANSAPSISAVAIAPSDVFEATELACTPDGWVDADGDSADYRFTWEIGGETVGTSASLTGGAFAKGDVITCTATPYDGEDAGAPVASASIAVQNTLPVLASAALSSSGPAVSDTLTALPGGTSDDDGDTVTLAYAWFVNGDPAGTGSSLASDAFRKGDEIWVVITPSDDVGAGAAIESAHAIAVNSAPVIDTLALTPEAPLTTDTLVASAGATDGDGDALTYSYELLVNGVAVDSNSSGTFAASWFAKDDTVQVRLTVNDGDEDSLPALSLELLVGNSAPSAPTVALSSLSPVEQAEDLICLIDAASVDADGDALTYEFTWLLDGVPFGGATTTTEVGDTVPSSETWLDQVWTCQVTVSDGTAVTDMVTAEATVIDWTGQREFTPCGAVGRVGPTGAACTTAYSGTLLAGEVVVSGGIQRWTVPADGTYVLEAYGARGGSIGVARGGSGAYVSGEFALVKGDVLDILVGQQGYQNVRTEAGGGGGSYIVLDGVPLLVAGGGGSQGGCSDNTGTYALGRPGVVTESGTAGYGRNLPTGGGAAGTGGNGGGAVTNNYPGGAGGGFLTGGAYGHRYSSGCSTGAAGFTGDDGNATLTAGGQGYLAGALGGRGCYVVTGVGGFGGGGGAGGCGGAGGGGYSGGGGGGDDVAGGGGGGSYNAGANAINTEGFNAADGIVTIDKL